MFELTPFPRAAGIIVSSQNSPTTEHDTQYYAKLWVQVFKYSPVV